LLLLFRPAKIFRLLNTTKENLRVRTFFPRLRPRRTVHNEATLSYTKHSVRFLRAAGW